MKPLVSILILRTTQSLGFLILFVPRLLKRESERKSAWLIMVRPIERLLLRSNLNLTKA
jgi:hypothetical protein